jgi:hypothetical protein
MNDVLLYVLFFSIYGYVMGVIAGYIAWGTRLKKEKENGKKL